MRQRSVEMLVHLMHREHTLSFLEMQSHMQKGYGR